MWRATTAKAQRARNWSERDKDHEGGRVPVRFPSTFLLIFLFAAPILRAQSRPPNVCLCKVYISAGIAEGLLISRVEPVFHHATQRPGVTGSVVVSFEIGKNGRVLNPKILSGPSALQAPVLAAVRKWRYRPYLLAGTPVQVETRTSLCVSNYENYQPGALLCPNPAAPKP